MHKKVLKMTKSYKYYILSIFFLFFYGFPFTRIHGLPSITPSYPNTPTILPPEQALCYCPSSFSRNAHESPHQTNLNMASSTPEDFKAAPLFMDASQAPSASNPDDHVLKAFDHAIHPSVTHESVSNDVNTLNVSADVDTSSSDGPSVVSPPLLDSPEVSSLVKVGEEAQEEGVPESVLPVPPSPPREAPEALPLNEETVFEDTMPFHLKYLHSLKNEFTAVSSVGFRILMEIFYKLLKKDSPSYIELLHRWKQEPEFNTNEDFKEMMTFFSSAGIEFTNYYFSPSTSTPSLNQDFQKRLTDLDIFVATDAATLNEKVKASTQGRIPSVSIPMHDPLLLNTLTFQLQWRYPFERENIIEPFHAHGGVKRAFHPMYLKEVLTVVDTTEFQAVELPFLTHSEVSDPLMQEVSGYVISLKTKTSLTEVWTTMMTFMATYESTGKKVATHLRMPSFLAKQELTLTSIQLPFLRTLPNIDGMVSMTPGRQHMAVKQVSVVCVDEKTNSKERSETRMLPNLQALKPILLNSPFYFVIISRLNKEPIFVSYIDNVFQPSESCPTIP
ncbi:hypothetical protein HMI54_007559 [Coelomomyces lativittatus]|nr:hypothetical protein HMI54_007559 [Coelomomyces lativittatus]KAJ1513463.1 hypothetical protein HMI56_002416 [Coelomomyces lativittatus]KAJ1517174.1 hypothetical protein HMI55_000448 [Coelomomyces lativittatus]